MTPEAPAPKGTGAVNTRGAGEELARIRWRSQMMAAGRVEELREIARCVKFQDKLTFNPGITP